MKNSELYTYTHHYQLQTNLLYKKAGMLKKHFQSFKNTLLFGEGVKEVPACGCVGGCVVILRCHCYFEVLLNN